MYICKWVYNIQKLKLYMRLYTHTSLYCKSFQKSFYLRQVCTICFVYILQIHVQFCAKVGAFVFCIHIHVQILNTWSMHVQVPVAFDNKVLIMEEAVIIYLLVFKNWNTVMLSDLLYISLRVEYNAEFLFVNFEWWCHHRYFNVFRFIFTVPKLSHPTGNA